MPSFTMNGWDVISVVSVPFLNTAIQVQGTSPRTLRVSNGTLDVQAAFGAWQITAGGDGKEIMMSLPLQNISGTVSKTGEVIDQFSYPSLSVTVQVELAFVGTAQQNLVVDAGNPPTSVMSLVDATGKELANAMDVAFIKEALVTWLDGNLGQFTQVFACVDLYTGIAGDEAWAFCKPSAVSYAYVQGGTLANSYLGVLYNTAGSTSQGGVPQIDPTYIPVGSEAAFILSPQMFLNNFLLPATARQFGVSPADLVVDVTSLNISLAPNAQVKLRPLPTVADSVVGMQLSPQQIEYIPNLLTLNVQVVNSVITVFSKTSTLVLDEWYGTVTAFDDSQSWFVIGLDSTGSTLVYTHAQPSVNDHSITQSEGFTIIQDVLQTIGIVTLAVATVLTDGAALLVAGALATMAQGAIQVGLNSFEAAHQDDAPSIDTLVSNLTLPVQWMKGGSFKPVSAGLNDGAFFLAGNLVGS